MTGCLKLSFSATMLLALISVVALVCSSNGQSVSGGGVERSEDVVRSRGTPGEPLENSVTSKLTYHSVTYSRDWIDGGLDVVYGMFERRVNYDQTHPVIERKLFVVAIVILSILLVTSAKKIYDRCQRKQEKKDGPSAGMNA